jgi:hypothetical protein
MERYVDALGGKRQVNRWVLDPMVQRVLDQDERC